MAEYLASEDQNMTRLVIILSKQHWHRKWHRYRYIIAIPTSPQHADTICFLTNTICHSTSKRHTSYRHHVIFFFHFFLLKRSTHQYGVSHLRTRHSAASPMLFLPPLHHPWQTVKLTLARANWSINSVNHSERQTDRPLSPDCTTKLLYTYTWPVFTVI